MLYLALSFTAHLATMPSMSKLSRAFALSSLVGLTFSACQCQPAEGLGAGFLRIDVDPQTVTLGNYRIELGAEALTTHHPSSRAPVFESLAGRAFVGAATGVEAITEARGLFEINDRLEVRCQDQTIEAAESDENAVTLRGLLRCTDGESRGYSFRLSATDDDHLRLEVELDAPAEGDRIFLYPAASDDEEFYGLGTQYARFDHNGTRVPIVVSEQGIGRGVQPLSSAIDVVAGAAGRDYHSYAPVPHVTTSAMRSYFLENNEISIFDFTADDHVQIEVFGSALVARAIGAARPLDLIESYTRYSGRMRALPEWITSGAVIGLQGGTEKVRALHETLQAEDTPVAGYWLQDWEGQRRTSFGEQLWWNWELDEDRYPNWDALVTDLESDGAKVMVYVNPFLVDVEEKENHRRNLFREAEEAGYLVRTEEGEPYLIPNTDFSAAMLDLTNPDAVEWMKGVLVDEVLSVGATGWMADFGEGLPLDSVLHDGDPMEVHNRYPEMWAELNRDVVEAQENADELTFFMRSGYTRSVAHSTLFWLGDQLVTWDEDDGLRSAITAQLTSGLSGYAFQHSDIGGYTGVNQLTFIYFRSAELLARWAEFSAFTPVYRTHEGNLPIENHQFYDDAESVTHFARMAKVYKAWEFYRRELVQQAALYGHPITRHPWLVSPSDTAVGRSTHELFFVGDEIVVAPVSAPGIERARIYLPRGHWRHVWSDTVFDTRDGQPRWVTVDAPLGSPPVFVRVGSQVGTQFIDNLDEAGLRDL